MASTNGSPLIKLEGLKKVFFTEEVETHALSEIHLEIKQGDYVSIAGPSGCGKTTLLSILGLLDTPTEGSYLLEDRPVANLSPADRARIRNRRIGFIFQAFNLIGDLTVYENVELPLTDRGMGGAERKQRVQAALESLRMLQDLRFALRGFRRSPAFVATVVLTIALGLGLNTSVFTIFNAYVLRPLAIRDPGSLYEVFFQDRRGWGKSLSWRQYQDLRALPISSESFAYKSAFARSERGPMLGNVVTGDAFRALGAAPALGRTLLPEDATLPHGEPVLVLSYDAWRGKFGGDSGVIGRKIVVHGIPLTVVGVAAKRFTGIGRTLPPDFWAPVTLLSRLEGSEDVFGAKEPEVLRAVLRLKPGVDERQARAALATWAANATATLPDSLRWTRADLFSVASPLPLTPETIAMFTPAVVAFGLVLLIASANVANVMLARGLARQPEIRIRVAMDAP